VPRPQLTLIALNEFNRELLESAARTWKLPHLQRLVALKHSQTHSPDTYESDFLEPWVQWVSVQSGSPSHVHGIKHLGDVSDLQGQQIWEVLSARGLSSGVWGAMNARRGQAPLCKFFVPDPWTFTESAYPARLSAFLDFPRYFARNYLSASKWRLVKLFARFGLGLLKHPRSLLDALRILPHFLACIRRFPTEIFSYFAFAELLLARVFFDHKRHEQTDFNLFFINGIAHLQHYDWHATPLAENKRFEFGFRVLDSILALVFSSQRKGEALIVMNALSQSNTVGLEIWKAYKIRDPEKLFRNLGLRFEGVEPLMSYDGYLSFSRSEDASHAAHLLGEAKILGKALFLVEANPKNPLRIFYRSQFYDGVDEGARFEVGGTSFSFSEHFKCLTTRTGKHIPTADLYAEGMSIPASLMNHEVTAEVLKFLSPKHSRDLAPGETAREAAAIRPGLRP
jgi:hypothetical protein